MKKVGIFYGSDGGTTQEIAQRVADKLGGCELFDVAQAQPSDIESFDNLIFATPTYGAGDLQDDWDSFLSKLDESVFAGKKIALLGLGDQEIYSDTFCSGIGHIYEKVSKQGTIIGQTATDGYTFDESMAVVNGKFVGLVIDEVNQDDMSDARIGAWVDLLKANFM